MPKTTNFQTLELPAVGDSFISSVKDLSTQSIKNMFPQAGPDAKTRGALLSFPGIKAWSTGTAGESDRGSYDRVFNGYMWKVSGQSLYKIDSNGTQSNVGTISGQNEATFADNGTILAICGDAKLYQYTGGILSEVSLSFTPVMVDYLNNQFLVLDTDGVIHVSDVGTISFDVSNIFEAESNPDDTLAIKVFNQFLFNFGEKSIEPWENTGTGTPPFERMNGAIIEDVGLANRKAMTETSDAIYFLGSDRSPYRLINFQVQPLGEANPGIGELFKTYSKDSCILTKANIDGQDIIIWYFPTESKTWCLSDVTGVWFELDYKNTKEMYLGRYVVELFDKVLIGDRTGGNVYELDKSTYQNNSQTMVRERTFRPFSGEGIGLPRETIQMRLIRFLVETGVGVDDDNPQMMVDISLNGGRTFTNERWLSLGEEGDYQRFVEYHSNKRFKDLVVRVRYSENTRFSLLTSSIDWRPAGR